jgi:mono/diheme cytochrome c family protein
VITTILIVLLALVAFVYVSLPLLFPAQSDPLPDDRDPVLTDLHEERDALFRAIRELDSRQGFAPERLAELRARYEAKAAKTLEAIDARQHELQGRPAPRARGPRRVPVGAMAALTLVLVMAALLPTFVLPRVGQDATVTTTDVAAATQLRDLQRAAQDDPSADNLLALGDLYLSLQMLPEASDAYQRVVDTMDPVPAGAYQRLAVLAFGTDLTRAQEMLELARDAEPENPDTLFLLSEVAYANGELGLAHASLLRFLDVMPQEPDPSVLARLALLEELTVLGPAAAADPSEANLMALADAYWRGGDPENAVNVYFSVLTGTNPSSPVALARTGEAMLIAGSQQDGVALLERAATAAGSVDRLEPGSVLALGNGYFALARYQEAADAYSAYLAAVGEDSAGNVTTLLESAQARAAGLPDPHQSAEQVSGQLVFAANCAVCHGSAAQGGSGPALAGSPRAANAANVRDAVAFGRGLMPGFTAQLSEPELEAVVTYVTQVLATAR